MNADALPNLTYKHTYHAHKRAQERGISQDDIALALAGRRIEVDGRIYHYGRCNHVVVVTTMRGYILTTFRVKKSWVKRQLSR